MHLYLRLPIGFLRLIAAWDSADVAVAHFLITVAEVCSYIFTLL